MDHIGVGHKTKNTVKHIYRSDYNLMKSYLDLMKLIIVKTGIGLLPSHSLMTYYVGYIGILRVLSTGFSQFFGALSFLEDYNV